MQARSASAELTERLAFRLGNLEAEVGHLRQGVYSGAIKPNKLSPEELEKLQAEVNILEAKLKLVIGEAGEEARQIWIENEDELPRLRIVEMERRKLQATLAQARWDKDSLERDYDRIVRGLEEQEEQQEQRNRALRE